MSTYRLDTTILKTAYANGYFPMPHPETNEICWFNPDPRAIIPLNGFHCSRSLRRKINKKLFNITYNEAFMNVMKGCANREETWITEEFIYAYTKLHKEGFAHSVEVWLNDELVGGVYGVSIGGAFFAESKFHSVTDASKVALYYLVEHLNKASFKLLEVQFMIPHLKSLGAVEIPALNYLSLLKRLCKSLLALLNSSLKDKRSNLTNESETDGSIYN